MDYDTLSNPILSIFLLIVIIMVRSTSQLTQEEFKTHPLVSSVTRHNAECPEAEETEEVRMVEGEKIRAVFIHDYPILQRSADLQYNMCNENSLVSKWDIYHRPYLNCKEQDDPYLVGAVNRSFLTRPDAEKDYKFTVPVEKMKLKGQSELAQDVDDLVFKNQLRNGFFIEAGATDGETSSNTLFFELQRNWTGLLVEPLPYNLGEKNRKAYISPVCLSTKTMPEIVNFDLHAFRDANSQPISMSGIVQDGLEGAEVYKIQCFPLFTLLLALGNPTVHYFILDIEGAELQVLRTIPWDQVDIEVLSVETDLAGKVMDGSRQEIIDLMESAGYTRFDHRNNMNPVTGKPQDDLFVRNDVIQKYTGVEGYEAAKHEL
jgi:hypothetical protein